jgi:geranylgeranyl pyrophosphate synthase
MVSNPKRVIQSAVKQYGLNFGIAFQIIDDCLDLISRRKDLGKSPGADFKMGELTLPVLNLFSQSQGKDRERIISLLKQQQDKGAFQDLRRRFINSPAFFQTKEDISYYIQRAKQSLNRLVDSEFKNSLLNLADFMMERLEV